MNVVFMNNKLINNNNLIVEYFFNEKSFIQLKNRQIILKIGNKYCVRAIIEVHRA